MSVLLTLALPVAGSCADLPKAPEKADATVEATKDGAKADHAKKPVDAAAAAAALEAETNPSGKVVETMEGGGYTYANLEKDGKKTWVAFPTYPTKVGDKLTFKGCMAMPGFQSKALNRKFEVILFCNAPEGKPKAAAAQTNPVAGKKSPGSGGAVIKSGGKIKVEKASGANAYTVAEIFAKRAALNGKQIVVKGQVVKVSSGIMDKNWIHLQDGTGDEKKKTNDLVITSSDAPNVGEVITISGTLAKDKDFGGGYKYSVIIEKGHLKK
jgi:hypothetical protein